ncbi:histidine kinase-like protein [Actinocorallia herbida]|uniref:Histidine kinase-like protein n=1 Tax=Actinocorallia herbida TaxID=58109 RepID=A0A3N1DAP0_9ACTN|nr:ATP-binding protein [Actinocorallia herbida]ROO90595.1 histidine kinase-like protein [Actinocorallia herbida]
MTSVLSTPSLREGEWLRARGARVWRATFPGHLDQVRRARAFVRILLAGTGLEDDAALIVTELANNSLQHTRSGADGGWFGVEVVADGARVIVSVTDQGANSALAWENSGPLAEEGRGLFIVADLAASHGTRTEPGAGHTVWAELIGETGA